MDPTITVDDVDGQGDLGASMAATKRLEAPRLTGSCHDLASVVMMMVIMMVMVMMMTVMVVMMEDPGLAEPKHCLVISLLTSQLLMITMLHHHD